MDALEWWKSVGSPQARQAVEAAGTSWEYFQHIAHRRKRPGPDLARRLIAASGGAMTLDELLFPKAQFSNLKTTANQGADFDK